jgi:hypothetical protein
MAGSFSDILATAVKTTYSADRVETMDNLLCKFAPWLDKNTAAHKKGGTHKFYAILAGPGAVGYHADTDSMPVPNDRTGILLTLNPVLMTATMQIGEMTRYAANSDSSAFNGGEMAQRIKESFEEALKRRERMYAGTHGTGRIGVVDSDGAGSTVVLAEHEGITLCHKNDLISFRTADGGDVVRDTCDNRRIDTITPATLTIKYSGADQTLVAGDHVHLITKAAQTSLSTVNPNGLRGLIDNASLLATVHGQARGTYSDLNAQVNANGGTDREISQAIISQLLNEIERITGTVPTDIWTSIHQARMFFKFVQQDRQVVTSGANPRYTTGYSEDQFRFETSLGTMTLHRSADIVPREAYFLNKRYIFRYVAKPLGWTEVGPGRLLPIPATDTYKSAWFAASSLVENIGCTRFDVHGVIRDLRDPMYDGAL